MSFSLFHVHSCHSLYDGGQTPRMIASRAEELGAKAVSLNDHGTMAGVVEFMAECKKHNIKPIPGIEGYFQPSFSKLTDEQKEENKERKKKGEKLISVKRFHLTLLAKSKLGYQNLTQAIQYSLEKGKYYYTTIFDYEVLEQFHEDVICLSGCPAGFLPSLIMSGDKIALNDHLKHFLQIFGKNFLFEVMPHDFEFNEDMADGEEGASGVASIFSTKVLNREVIKLSDKFKIPAVMTTDSHYQRKEQYSSYLVMHKLRGHDFANDYTHLYLPSEDEAREWWASFMGTDPSKYIEMTETLADMVDVDLSFKETVPQLFEGEDGQTSDDVLVDLAVDGMKRLGLTTKEYKRRMRKELDIVFEKGYSDYFLLCLDIIRYAEDHGIAVGFGRGSVCGSLLAYCIGLTKVDPIRFDIVFERFLRPNRTTMPDIDMDFCTLRREQVISYVLSRFPGGSAPIAAYGCYKIKMLVNDLARLFEMSKEDAFIFKRELETYYDETVENTINSADYDMLISNRQLKRLDTSYGQYEPSGDWVGVLRHFCYLYGQIRFVGQHAAGVAIVSGNIGEYVPLVMSRGKQISAYDKDSLGSINIVKIDMLALATATTIKETEEMIGCEFSYDMLNDEEVYRQFREGNTTGIFQFESWGAKDVLATVQPDNIEELIACNAINRPGAKELSLQTYAENKKKGTYKKAIWDRYTDDTYGCILYQEQVMRICREMAGMNWNDVDFVIKHLGKDRQLEGPIYNAFIAGMEEKSGVKPAVAKRLYDIMTQYLFNKGHGTGYTLMSYYQMWLKVHYPLQFWFSLIKNEDVDDKRLLYESEAVKSGIIIFPPSINGDVDYSLVRDGDDSYLVRGLKTIPHVGETIARAIVEERKKHGDYETQNEVLFRLPQRVMNTRVTGILEKHGAFEVDFKKRCSLAIDLCKQLKSVHVNRWGNKKRAE